MLADAAPGRDHASMQELQIRFESMFVKEG
jgi:hypothetical protein